MPTFVPRELGDRQRLRMLTAKVGSPKDLVKLNRLLRRNGKARESGLPVTLGIDLRLVG